MVKIPHLIHGLAFDVQNEHLYLQLSFFHLYHLTPDLHHIPKYFLQPLHPIFVKGGHIGGIFSITSCYFNSEYRQHFPPVRQRTISLNPAVRAFKRALDLFQLFRVFFIDLGNSRRRGNRSRSIIFPSCKNAERRSDYRSQSQHEKKKKCENTTANGGNQHPGKHSRCLSCLFCGFLCPFSCRSHDLLRFFYHRFSQALFRLLLHPRLCLFGHTALQHRRTALFRSLCGLPGRNRRSRSGLEGRTYNSVSFFERTS